MAREKVVSLGLDACDPALAGALAERGVMPNLARLLAEGSRCTVENPFGLFVGSLWVSYASAQRASTHGYHCWDEIDPASYERRFNTPRFAHLPCFWEALSEAGRSVATFDVPHRLAGKPLNGLEISEWGCHDRHSGLRSSPATLADEVERSHGNHPALGIQPRTARDFSPDDWFERAGPRRTADEERAFLDGMLEGLESKRRITLDLLGRRDWDFFVAVFGESHATGHQLWHLHDKDHPRFDAATLDLLGGDPIVQVYAALDRAVGDVIDAIGEDCLLLVHLSHGMGAHFDCTHMLEEILTRLDASDNGPARARAGRWMKRMATPWVTPLRRVAHAVRVPSALRRRVGQSLLNPEIATPDARARQRYFAEPNNSVYGGVRVNLAGREARGCVAPGEFDAVCAGLAADLLAITDADSGAPVVRAVHRCDDHHQRRRDDVLPDLLVEWTREVQTAAVTSPRIGRIDAPYLGYRSGDHYPDGMLIARGPGIAAGSRMPSLKVEDIGPTIAARLGVSLSGVDGTPAAWLAKERAALTD